MIKKSLLWIYSATYFLIWLTIFIFATSVLSLRYFILPNIGEYKSQIAEQVSKATNLKVDIGNINASWDGLNPHLSLIDVIVYDAHNRPALSLNHVEASLSWLSIPLLEPRFSSLTINHPELTIRREASGAIYLAGISLSGGASKPTFPNWLLRQIEINVLNASLVWQDDMRGAPPLSLNKLNLRINNPAWQSLLGRHHFGLTAVPSVGPANQIDIRGDIYGRDVAKLNTWDGIIYGKVDGTEISAWQQWVTYPFNLKEGSGASQFWIEFDEGSIQKVTADVLLSHVKTQLHHSANEANLDSLSGRLVWQHSIDGDEIQGTKLRLVTDSGLNMHNGSIGIRQKMLNNKEVIDGNIALDEMRLETLANFVSYFPISQDFIQKINEIAPTGKFSNLKLTWSATEGNPTAYHLSSKFDELGMHPYEKIPGFNNLSGEIYADESKGKITLASQQAALNAANTLRWPIPFEKLAGTIHWQLGKNKTALQINNLMLSNSHLSGIINASYDYHGVGKGYLDLTGKIDGMEARYAHLYFPTLLNAESLNWLDHAFLGGKAEDINVVLKGNLEEFPFNDKKTGLFKVTAKMIDGQLDYSPGWPTIDDIQLNMLFQGDRMDLDVQSANSLGNHISKAKISIPALDSHQSVLDVVGEINGPVSDAVHFVNASPLLGITKGITEDMQTTGNGKLNLELHIPLHDVNATKVKAGYQISNGSLVSANIPPLTQLNGRLEITESFVRAQNVSTFAYGGPATFSLNTGKDHAIRILAKGHASDVGLKQAFGFGFLDKLSGSADWTSNITIADKELDILVNSNLMGMASNLPAPLNKQANEILPFRFDKKDQGISTDNTNITVGNVLSIKTLRTNQGGALKFDRGEIAINTPAELPSQAGFSLRGTLDQVDFDDWKNVLEKSTSSDTSSGMSFNKIDLTVNAADILDKRINNLKLTGKSVSDGWQFNIQSKEVNGDAQWHNSAKPKITARLKNFTMPAGSSNPNDIKTQPVEKYQGVSYPALDIMADDFEFNKKKLGKLELVASQQDDDWSIEKLKITAPESVLSAEGEWHNWKKNPNTRINFTWTISDLGKSLDRFGYISTIKAGEADLSGQLKWPGSPHEFDYPDLSGNLQLDARKGQILKIQPGVGRLFSVLSLQNLPRRLTLDFRDVFSSGFTFDKINSNVKIDKGMMKSDDFKMEGPTAKVELKGETDLQKETQHLYIKVTPYISDSLSIAALAGGPVVGAAAYIAQKLLKDPINKLAADEYEIVGTWDNPQEAKDVANKPKANTGSPGNMGH